MMEGMGKCLKKCGDFENLVPENSRWQCMGTPCREGCAMPRKANDVTGFSTLTADMPSTPGSATVAML